MKYLDINEIIEVFEVSRATIHRDIRKHRLVPDRDESVAKGKYMFTPGMVHDWLTHREMWASAMKHLPEGGESK
jgi:predicted DNA-binding transcriptional regulator YafY